MFCVQDALEAVRGSQEAPHPGRQAAVQAKLEKTIAEQEDITKSKIEGYEVWISEFGVKVQQQAETIQHLVEVLRADGYRVSQTASGTIVLQ